MDQFSAAELVEIFYLTMTVADTQFQYWITVTFAAVVAGFIAGDRLKKRLRIAAASLYLLASFVLISRFFATALSAGRVAMAMEEMGVDIVRPVGTLVVVARILLFILGTVAALYVLLREQE